MQKLTSFLFGGMRIVLPCAVRPAILRYLEGMLCGAVLLIVFHQFLLTFGTSRPIVTGIALCTGLAVVGGRWNACGGQSCAFGWLGLGLWSVAVPALQSVAGGWWQEFPLDQLSTTSIALLLATASAFICLGPGFGLTAKIAFARNPALFLFGFATCWLTAPILLAGVASLNWAQLVLGLMASAWGTWCWWTGSESGVEVGALVPKGSVRATRFNFPQSVQTTLMAAAVGVGLAVALHICRQLTLSNLITEHAAWSGAFLGTGLGWWWSARSTRCVCLFSWAGIIGLAAVVLIPASYGGLTHFALWTTAWVSHAGVLFLVRGLMFATLTLPFGIPLGIAWGQERYRLNIALGASAAVAGFLVPVWIGASPLKLALAAAVAFLLATFISWTNKAFWAVESAPQRNVTAVLARPFWSPVTAATLLVAGSVSAQNYRPDLSERVLFSSTVFAAYREGTPAAQLPYLDDGRLIQQFESANGRWSLWKYRGSQLVLRRNGIPVSWTSASPRICPDSSVDVLSVLLPLVMHPAAERVMLLGSEGTVPLVTALSFPVLEVKSVSPTAASTKAIETVAELSRCSGYLADSRLHRVSIDPALAVKAKPADGLYDLIVSHGARVAVLESAPQFTRRFYQGVRGHLAENGIFAQRFSYIDLGPESVQQVVATLRAVFPHAVMTEIAPGELLFVCKTSGSPAFDAETVDRLKFPHVREILAKLGWDWSVVASLGSLDAENCATFSSGVTPVAARCPPAAYRLPIEVARWGDKFGATRTALSEYGEVLGNWLDEGKERHEIGQRLDDVNLARQVEHDHPDHYWAYRATLKERLQKRPRTDIIPVKDEGLTYGLHPEDQRRKDYLRALGEAAKQEHPSPEAIARLNQFVAPYDPLVSYFAHLEMAALYGRCEKPKPEQRLIHLLHAIYFGAALDRSVRHICSALEVLNKHPECIPDPVARWDHQNGLLEMLRYRWDQRVRGEAVPRKYDVGDTERSLDVALATLKVMGLTRQQASVSKECWLGRRAVLDDKLIHLLRAHRSDLTRREALIPVAPSESGGESAIRDDRSPRDE